MNLSTGTPFPNPPRQDLTWTLVALILRVLLVVVGVPCNTWAIYKLLQGLIHKRNSTAFLKFKLHLALSDNCVLLLYCLSNAVWQWTYQWYGGTALCKIMAFSGAFSFHLSSNVMVCIAMERWINVARRHRHSPLPKTGVVARIKTHRIRSMLLFAWGAGILSALPQLIVWTVHVDVNGKGSPVFQQCTTKWKSESHIACSAAVFGNDSQQFQTCIGTERSPVELLYNYVHLLIIFWLPCAIIVTANVKVIQILHARTRASIAATLHRNSISCEYDPLSDWRVVIRASIMRKTLMLSAAYVLLWLPYNILNLLETITVHIPPIAGDIMADIMVVNSVINPLLYRSRNYKRCRTSTSDEQARTSL